MSNFDYHYSKGDKYPADDVINNLRESSDATKAEAIDWLIDKGFLHSDELYNAAYVLAMADAVGISYEGKYDDEDDECQCVGVCTCEFNSEDEGKPVGNPKRLGRGVDWRPHEDNYLPSQHDRMRAEAYRGYSYERPMFMKVLGLGLLSAFAIALLKIDSDKTEDTNE